VIRPAVESAIAVARAGLNADPVVPPPPALRPYLQFARQRSKSLEAIARVVDTDPEFRARVAEAVDEVQLGRAGWLWLTRPDGWEDELAALEAESAARAVEASEQREDRAALRKLAAAEAAVARAESEAAAHLGQLDIVRADLAEARAEGLAAASRVREVEAALDALTTERAAVVRNLKEVEARLVERGTEVNALRARVRALEAELRDGGGGAGAADEGVASRPPGLGDAADPGVGGLGDAADPGVGGVGDAADPAPSSLDPARVAGEIARAAAGARGLADALGALAGLLGVPGGPVAGPQPAMGSPSEVAAEPPSPGTPRSSVMSGASGASAKIPHPAPARRVPLRLPGGVFDDSVEAADHLLRTPGVVLVVDGYNVTMTGWPGEPAAEQRQRLLAAVSDLAHRTTTRVELVFDGAEVDAAPVPATVRRLVRTRFSPPDVEADDVIIDLAARIPATTPVVVASSDNRVRAGARRAGANVVHARQLLAVLGVADR
jgi:predicted RNA-binding protein with PIN domain